MRIHHPRQRHMCGAPVCPAGISGTCPLPAAPGTPAGVRCCLSQGPVHALPNNQLRTTAAVAAHVQPQQSTSQQAQRTEAVGEDGDQLALAHHLIVHGPHAAETWATVHERRAMSGRMR